MSKENIGQPKEINLMSAENIGEQATESQSSDSRQEFRLATQLVVFLERAAAFGTTPAAIAVCQTKNISANGLSVITDQMLTPDTIVRACVQTLDYNHRFTLCIEVKWCTATDDPEEFAAGLAIYESQDTDIIRWKEFIAQQYLSDTPEIEPN